MTPHIIAGFAIGAVVFAALACWIRRELRRGRREQYAREYADACRHFVVFEHMDAHHWRAICHTCRTSEVLETTADHVLARGAEWKAQHAAL